MWKLTDEWANFMLVYETDLYYNSICTQDLSSLWKKKFVIPAPLSFMVEHFITRNTRISFRKAHL